MSNYTIFLQGELVSLCVPSKRAIDVDGWTDWFNDISRLGATRHGVFPNTEAQQVERLTKMPANDITLLICDVAGKSAYGTVSLQQIDLAKKDAEISITLSQNSKSKLPKYAALEAMSLLTSHGFDEVGLLRISAGQAAHLLVKWNQQMELIGYRTEGIMRGAFLRGHTRSDIFRIAALYEHYISLKSERNGVLWPGAQEISNLTDRQPNISFAEKASKALRELEETHFSYLYK